MTLCHTTASLIDDPLYLDRCQVDTPHALVERAWAEVRARRATRGAVVDFGAGDARFSKSGFYTSYVGYEIDTTRCAGVTLPRTVEVRARCAFDHTGTDADICIGNPPYVRNQDLPAGWRVMAAEQIRDRTGVQLSGLANAWQYFLMLGLASTKPDGLVVQVLPYEWISRPSVSPVRNFITSHGWGVSVFRLPNQTFSEVMTAASLTVIDKRESPGWKYFDLAQDGKITRLPSASGRSEGVLSYVRADPGIYARRGLSPGTQKLLTLTEGERVHAGLHVSRDVVRCVTTLRDLPAGVEDLDIDSFDRLYRNNGLKCWLIRTDREPSKRLAGYLASCSSSDRDTATCMSRTDWWRFAMPEIPPLLVSQAFKGKTPTVIENSIGVRAVGGVCGVYGLGDRSGEFKKFLEATDLSRRLVPYANHLYKLEIGQLNSLLSDWDEG